MSISEQVDAVQARAAELKSSADQARHETNEQVRRRWRPDQGRHRCPTGCGGGKAGQAAEQDAESKEEKQCEAAAKMQALQDPPMAASATSVT